MYYDEIDQYVDRFYREREEASRPEEPIPGPLDDFPPDEIARALDALDPEEYPGARGDPWAIALMARVLRALGLE